MISFYLSETFRLFRKGGYNSFILIIITSLASIVSVISISLVYGVNTLDQNLKSGIRINVFLESGIQDIEAREIESSINKISGVKRVVFISKEEATQKFIKETGEDFKEVLDENPLPNSFKVSLDASIINESNVEKITRMIKQISGVNDVIFDYETTLRLFRFLKMIQYFFYPLALVLVILSVYLVYSNNKLQIRQNNKQFSTMNLVGGKTSSIRIPIILNGVLIGVLSSLFCVILVNGFIALLIAYLNSFKLSHYFLLINILIIAINLLLAILGSILSSREIVSGNK